MVLDWESAQTEVFLNPRLPEEDKKLILSRLQTHPLNGHIWLSTSGSMGKIKWAAISKEAFLCSAASVNAHLKSSAEDVWIRSMPLFHVGGLGISARCHLSGATIVEVPGKWDALNYHKIATESQGTLTSLVPAQVYDLVASQLKSPPSLRAALVGGGALQESLYHKAWELGWPLLPTYGMTETSTGIATASYPAGKALPVLKVMSHVQVAINSTGRIRVKSPALFSLYANISVEHFRFDDPKTDGWYTTEDKGKLEGNILTVLGRDTHFVKIGGESVDLMRLENLLEEVKLEYHFPHDLALLAIPDPRLGHVIHVATTCSELSVIEKLLEAFHKRILPYEKVRRIHTLPYIPRTDLHKVLHGELIKMLQV